MSDYTVIEDAGAFDEQAMEEATYFSALARIAEEIKRYDLSVVLYDLMSNEYITSDELRVAGADLSKLNQEDIAA